MPLPPPEREWITLEDSTGSNGQDTFTMFCYNILAENYATPQMYGYTPSWALTWEYRKELILQEILAYGADVVCLQVYDQSGYSFSHLYVNIVPLFLTNILSAHANPTYRKWNLVNTKTISRNR